MTESNYTPPDITLLGEEHITAYRETGGEVGYLWNGATCLILGTTGRKTGQPRDVALICGFDGDNPVVVASYGGSPTHPAWYLNLVAEPKVTVQVKAEVFDAVARTVEGDERDRMWEIVTKNWPNYNEYVKRTTRRIPVVVLERAPS